MRRLISLSILSLNCAWADPVWHCSRSPELIKTDEVSLVTSFSIASLGTTPGVIGVSLNDLIDVYSGVPVRIGGLILSACYKSDEPTSPALSSIGIQPSTIHALTRKTAIIQSNLYIVGNESQMASCIEKNFPAVGYLDVVTDNDAIGPCF